MEWFNFLDTRTVFSRKNFFSEFLYYTDWTYPYIRRMGLGIAESQEENFGPEIFDRPSGIISVVEWNDAKANSMIRKNVFKVILVIV